MPDPDDIALSPLRARASTAPSPEAESSHATSTASADDDIDEELRLAQAMAIAIQNNPNLTPAEAQELVQKTMGASSSSLSGSSQPPQALTSSMLIPGRLSDMLQQTALEAERKANTLRERAKGMFTMSVVDEGTSRSSSPTSFDPIRLSGIAWKRRGGMGKYSSLAWERRRIELRGTKLLYYRNDNEEMDDSHRTPMESDDEEEQEGIVVAKRSQNWVETGKSLLTAAPTTTPRGHVDIIKERATVQASFATSGAPTPFCLTIWCKGESKWKLCFDYHETQIKWMAALSDVVIQSSIDHYNSEAEGDKKWALDTYQVRSSRFPVDLDDAEVLTTPPESERNIDVPVGAASVPSLTLPEVRQSVDSTWRIPQTHAVRLLAALNLSLVMARATSVQGFWYILILAHAAIYCCAIQEPDWKALVEMVNSRQPEIIIPTKDASTRSIHPEKPKQAYIPEAGCSTVQLKEPTDKPVNSKNEMFAGWRAVDPSVLAIRSFGYTTSKKKIPSPGSLYICSKVDIFESASRYPDMAPRVKLPNVSFEDDGQPKTWRSPNVFIVSIALPTDPPKLGRSSSDGGGYTVTCYFTMREETRSILRKITAPDATDIPVDDPETSKVNAVRLFEEWVRRAPNDPKWFSRFKVVPNAHNLKEIGMPSWISKYNGKPFLIKRPGTTGFIHEHPELSCMEFDVSLHPFPYLAKQAICFMKDSYFAKILVTFGFVIEAKTEDELPECILGCMQLCYPDPQYAIQGSEFMNGTANRSTG